MLIGQISRDISTMGGLSLELAGAQIHSEVVGSASRCCSWPTSIHPSIHPSIHMICSNSKTHNTDFSPSRLSHRGFVRRPGYLTYAVRLHVALVGHAVPPQTLVGIVPGETVLHPVVRRSGDHQQDITNDGTEQAPSHEAVHLELR